MKLLDNGELTRVDSSPETISKWHEFFEMALPNMGYREDLINDSYPYSAGIPLITNETMPVSSNTGRAFWQMSWADKISFFVCATYKQYPSKLNDMFMSMKQFLDRDEVFATVWESINHEPVPAKLTATQKKNYIKEILLDCEIQMINSSDAERHHVPDKHFNTEQIAHLFNASCRDEVTMSMPESYSSDYTKYFVYFKRLNDIYAKFPVKALVETGYHNYVQETYQHLSELCSEEYMCISLNPIDKLMCSTKQSFGSCISLAKEKDIGGTNNINGLGIPGLFPSDAVYMLFMTSGKHKNMYWESEEWSKEGKDRDKTKAYKYLKMTSRSWTYKSKLECLPQLQESIQLASEDTQNFFNSSSLGMTRLQIGRQYSCSGEFHWWTDLAEKLLHKNGVCTGESQRDDLFKLRAKLQVETASSCRQNDLSRGFASEQIKRGRMTDHKIVETDRYGNKRSMYFDNVNIAWKYNDKGISDIDFAIAQTGRSRRGCGGASNCNPRSTLDAFKFMMGVQNYSFFDQNVHICPHCNELIQREALSDFKFQGDYICNKCVEEKDLVYCTDCLEYHLKEDIEKHEKYNVQELIHPNTFTEFEPINVCKIKLAATTEFPMEERNRYTRNGNRTKYVCTQCGQMHDFGYGNEHFLTDKNFKNISVRVAICQRCFQDATVCDKCKRIIIIDTIENAAILLPGKKVICRECVDSIRLKKAEKEKYKDLLKSLTKTMLEEPGETHNKELTQEIIQATGNRYLSETKRHIITKDVEKQMIGLLHRRDTLDLLEGNSPRCNKDLEERKDSIWQILFDSTDLEDHLSDGELNALIDYIDDNMNHFSYDAIAHFAIAIYRRIVKGKPVVVDEMVPQIPFQITRTPSADEVVEEPIEVPQRRAAPQPINADTVLVGVNEPGTIILDETSDIPRSIWDNITPRRAVPQPINADRMLLGVGADAAEPSRYGTVSNVVINHQGEPMPRTIPRPMRIQGSLRSAALRTNEPAELPTPHRVTVMPVPTPVWVPWEELAPIPMQPEPPPEDYDPLAYPGTPIDEIDNNFPII